MGNNMSTITITLTKEQADILSNTTNVSIDLIRKSSTESKRDNVHTVLQRGKESNGKFAVKPRALSAWVDSPKR